MFLSLTIAASTEGTTSTSTHPLLTSTVGSTSSSPSTMPSVTTSSVNVTTSAAAVTTSEFSTTAAASTTTREICEYTDWTQWTGCSMSCGVGQRSRSRDLVMDNWEMCTVCHDTTEQVDDCNTETCEEWNPWGQWSDCSVTENCTAGIRTRYRTCTGASCDGDAMELERCGQWCTEAEANCPANKTWMSCEHLESSLGAINCQEFSYDYETLAQVEGCGGGACVCEKYEHSESGECVTAASCPCYTEDGKTVWPGENVTRGCETCSCNHKFEWVVGINIPEFVCSRSASCCDWGEWTTWGSCNVTCGTGSKHRYRNLLNGEDCGPSIDTEDCSAECKADCVVNGTDYYCGNITSENSTHTCYCTIGNGTSCVEKIPEVGKCQKHTRTEVLYDQASGCTSQGNVNVDFCSGTCGNSSFEGMFVFNKTDVIRQSANCDCCTGIFSETMEEITLICGPNNEQKTAYLPKISKCTCSPCSGATSVTLPVTSQYTTSI